MSSEIKADKWSPASGTSATIGDSGDTFTIPSGVTLDTSSSTLTLPSSAITGQTAITSLADTDKFLVSDASDSGNLKYVEKQYLGGGGSLVYLGGINSSNYSASKLALQQVFTNDYRRYKVMGKFQGTGNGADVEFRWLNSSNSEVISNYYNVSEGHKINSVDYNQEGWLDWGQSKTRLFVDTATGSHIHSFSMDLFPNQNENVNYPTMYAQLNYWLYNNAANKMFVGQLASYVESTTSIAGGGMQLESTSGLFGTVNISIWGYKDS